MHLMTLILATVATELALASQFLIRWRINASTIRADLSKTFLTSKQIADKACALFPVSILENEFVLKRMM